MSTNRAPTVGHADWCPANGGGDSTTCVAIREEAPKNGQPSGGGPSGSVAVCQVCGVASPIR